MTRGIIQEALTLIKRTEALSLSAYHGKADANGIWTIGYGHVIKPNEQWMRKGITGIEANQIFAKDVAAHAQFIQQDIGLGVALDDFVYGALSSFCFNLGARVLLTAHHVADPMRQGHITEGVLQMYRFSMANGVYVDGLFYRRLTEMALALEHKLIMRPSNCEEVRQVILDLAAHGDCIEMEAYFTQHHRKEHCSVCQARNRFNVTHK